MNKGFTIFFAMLVSSLALAVGLAIFDLTVRELDLSSIATQSQYAIYAADAGVECALYWDFKCPTTAGSYCEKSGGSAFAISGAAVPPPPFDSGQPPDNSSLWCNSQDISHLWQSAQGGSIAKIPNAATTTFTINVSATSQVSATTTCATVSVGKYTDPGGVLYTTIISRGYNTCTPGITRVERALQIIY